LIDSSASLYVENLVDLEGPPTQMEYVNSYKVRAGVMAGGGGKTVNFVGGEKKKSQV
jgi:hypothetical protein